LAAGLCAPTAYADGDPASDFLCTQSLFLPFTTRPPATLATQLSSLLLEEFRKGNWMKVAVIAGPADLGAIPSLWLHPKQYAHFLGIELSCRFRGRLIVVMPNGIGLWHGGQPLERDTVLLRSIRVGAGVAGEMRAAMAAVGKLRGAAQGSASSTPPVLPPPPGVPC
jgi:hypothetical protein